MGENTTQISIIVLIFISLELGIVKILKGKLVLSVDARSVNSFLFKCTKYIYKHFQISVKVKFLISLWLSNIFLVRAFF